MKTNRIMILLLVFSLVPTIIFSQNFSDYLILQDIGPYKLEVPQKVVGGYIGGPRVFDGAGVLAPTGHFYLDHIDKTYEVYYEGGSNLASPTVQVTKHSGSDSDKWLVHEVERDFRTYYGLPGSSYVMRVIDGQTIMAVASGGREYRWLSGNKVIRIAYTDQMLEKPEPFEIVKAYLAKHPSTLTPMTSADLRTPENKTRWIKDEMDRRLWLCDKWFYQLQLGKVQQNEVFQQAVKSMEIFLNYREKYYGIAAQNEKQLLWGYRDTNNGTAIKTKLKEYKDWWALNKDKAISIQ